MGFAVISFASRALVIVSTAEDESADADEVLHRLENMTFTGASQRPGRDPGIRGRDPGVWDLAGLHLPIDHGNATGTNVRGALMEVYHMLLFQKARAERMGHPDSWRHVRHVIILLTDGGDLEWGDRDTRGRGRRPG